MDARPGFDHADDTMNVVSGADAGYGAWLGVMLASLLRFDHGPLHIHLMSDAIDPVSLARIEAMAGLAGVALSVHDIARPLDAQASLPVSGHVSRATYGRIVCADILPASVDRAIYLDVDLLCRSSLRPLWRRDLGDAIAGAALDCAVGDAAATVADEARRTRDRHAAHIGLPEDGGYFNTGVMLMDMARWRGETVGSDIINWLIDNPEVPQFADQDALNSVLHGRFLRLEDGWNRLTRWALNEPDDGVKIFHFAGPEKPWQADYQGVGLAEWRAVKAASPFRDVALAAARA